MQLHATRTLALASASRQRDVWLRPGEFEDLDHVVTVLFDDFCDADDPALMKGLGEVCLDARRR